MSKTNFTPTFIIENANDDVMNEKIATYLFFKAIHTSALEVVEQELNKKRNLESD